MGLRQPPSLTPSIDLIPSPLCLPDQPCAAIALALWQAASLMQAKESRKARRCLGPGRRQRATPSTGTSSTCAARMALSTLVKKKTSVCVEIRTGDRPHKIGLHIPPDQYRSHFLPVGQVHMYIPSFFTLKVGRILYRKSCSCCAASRVDAVQQVGEFLYMYSIVGESLCSKPGSCLTASSREVAVALQQLG